jgi:hypothetical protein
MIQGVHAETVAFLNPEQAAGLFRLAAWPWFGQQGQFATRRVWLEGTTPRDCYLRVTTVKVVDHRARAKVADHRVSCSVQLESGEGPRATPLMRAEITLAPAPTREGVIRSILTLQGMVVRDLAGPSGTTSTDATRRLANEYARSLLRQIAAAIEQQTAKIAAS